MKRSIPYTLAQRKKLVITPKISAVLSLISSAFIVKKVWNDHSNKRSNVVGRVLLCMSLSDIVSSFAWFLSSWPAPKGTFPFSVGNTATCSAQGLIMQLGLATPLYNAGLSFFYLLIIRYGLKERRLEQLERWVHVGILLFVLTTSLVCLSLGLYNPSYSACWIAPLPFTCKDNCIRGNNAVFYRLVFGIIPLWLSLFFCLACMLSIHMSVRKVEKRNSRYAVGPARVARTKRSKMMASNAAWYVAVLFLTWLPPTVNVVLAIFDKKFFWMSMIAGISQPLQGFYNCIIFIRRRGKLQDALTVAIRKSMRSSKSNIYAVSQDIAHRIDSVKNRGSNAGCTTAAVLSVLSPEDLKEIKQEDNQKCGEGIAFEAEVSTEGVNVCSIQGKSE
mmetsp:Transcript_53216/g.79028  ORF Transcript_53216/g.79028 Transcript_53216/m.79028 type:complete len:389 (+) Transcript_53216:78-1244(+)